MIVDNVVVNTCKCVGTLERTWCCKTTFWKQYDPVVVVVHVLCSDVCTQVAHLCLAFRNTVCLLFLCLLIVHMCRRTFVTKKCPCNSHPMPIGLYLNDL